MRRLRDLRTLFFLINVIFMLIVSMVMTGCISVESYRVRWATVSENQHIDASVQIASECKLTDGYRQTWKRALNPDSNIVNFLQAQCDSIVEDMTDSLIFRRVVPVGDPNYDLLIKLASIDSEVVEKISLSVVDPKSQDVIAIYKGSATYSGYQNNGWGDATKRVLADIRSQMIRDYLEGKGVKSFLVANGKIQEPLAQPWLTQPQQKIAVTSDVDELPSIKTHPSKNSYAIVIGIENYRQKLPKADYAASDAKAMTEYLTKVMGYPEENVVTLLNDRASMSDITKYFEKWLSNNVEKDSIVFIYYSGHGAPNPKTGDAYLVPYDGDPTFIAETGYSLKRLYENLGKLQAKEIIVVLDSCFSGAGGRSVLAKGARPLVMQMESFQIPQKIAVLSASSGDQISSTYEEKGHGLFTYFMLKGIKGEGDTNGDGKIEIGELFDYIKPQVERTARKTYNNEQSPQLIAPAEKKKMPLMER